MSHVYVLVEHEADQLSPVTGELITAARALGIERGGGGGILGHDDGGDGAERAGGGDELAGNGAELVCFVLN